jgi:hypothetical protein
MRYIASEKIVFPISKPKIETGAFYGSESVKINITVFVFQKGTRSYNSSHEKHQLSSSIGLLLSQSAASSILIYGCILTLF